MVADVAFSLRSMRSLQPPTVTNGKTSHTAVCVQEQNGEGANRLFIESEKPEYVRRPQAVDVLSLHMSE